MNVLYLHQYYRTPSDVGSAGMRSYEFAKRLAAKGHTVDVVTSRMDVSAELSQWEVTKRWSRILTCNLDGTGLYIFPTSGMVSHMAWRDADHILAYSRDINERDGYVLFKDQEPEQWSRVGDNAYNSDGHPSFAHNGHWIVTDTYPDRSSRSYVTPYDTVRKQRHNLAYLKHWKQFATPSPERHWACALHPRRNRAGTMVCFDSVYTEKRALCTIDVSELLQLSK